jgi:predicted metal-binding protein
MRCVTSDATGMAGEDRPTLYVCVSCRRKGSAARPEGSPPEGRLLCDVLQALLSQMGAEAPARAVPTLCFANCERGCSAAIAASGKWSYLMGGLGPEHAADLLTYAQAYAHARAGIVLPSGRPASLRDKVIARFPAHLKAIKGAAE